jgi:hypothetical protein
MFTVKMALHLVLQANLLIRVTSRRTGITRNSIKLITIVNIKAFSIRIDKEKCSTPKTQDSKAVVMVTHKIL